MRPLFDSIYFHNKERLHFKVQNGTQIDILFIPSSGIQKYTHSYYDMIIGDREFRGKGTIAQLMQSSAIVRIFMRVDTPQVLQVAKLLSRGVFLRDTFVPVTKDNFLTLPIRKECVLLTESVVDTLSAHGF